MFIVALTGLHGSGKSSVKDILHWDHSFIALDKLACLEQIHQASQDCGELQPWYQQLYSRLGGQAVMETIWTHFVASLPDEIRVSNIVIDSVHNVSEWKYLQSLCPNSTLVYVVSARQMRIDRTSEDHLTLDQKRLVYSHELNGPDVAGCLFAMADWSICNNFDGESLEAQVEQLVKGLAARHLPDAV